MKHVVLGMILGGCLLATGVAAHPPAEMALSYSHENMELRVVLRHVVDKMKKHYIKKIVIEKNAADPQTYFFHRQTTPTEFVHAVQIQANPGDVFKVKAYCSEGGDLENEYRVPSPEEPLKGDPENAPNVGNK